METIKLGDAEYKLDSLRFAARSAPTIDLIKSEIDTEWAKTNVTFKGAPVKFEQAVVIHREGKYLLLFSSERFESKEITNKVQVSLFTKHALKSAKVVEQQPEPQRETHGYGRERDQRYTVSRTTFDRPYRYISR